MSLLAENSTSHDNRFEFPVPNAGDFVLSVVSLDCALTEVGLYHSQRLHFYALGPSDRKMSSDSSFFPSPTHEMDLGPFGGTKVRRPSSLGFDLRSVASSGYCSAENSTESEYPPFDFDSVRDKLENLSKVEVSVKTPECSQFVLNDCFFTVHIVPPPSSPGSRTRTLEAIVEGPSGIRCEVFQSPGKKSSQIICTFRPLECGPHTCQVMLLHSEHPDPRPFVININRKYGCSKAITTVDVELGGSLPGPQAPMDMEAPMTQRKPWGICVNKKTEEMYVADRERHEILVYGPEGDLERRFGGIGQLPGKFFRPTAICFDETRDRILVADKDNHRIQILSPNGTFIRSFGRRGNYSGQFFFPWGIAISGDGRYIAVADSRNHRIQLFDHDGNFLRKYAASSNHDRRSNAFKKEFDYPRGVCFDKTGKYIYVTDFNLHALFRLSIDFKSCEKILGDNILKRPQGITVDDCGNILVCDSRHNSVKVVSSGGKLVGEFSLIGTKDGVELPLDIDIMRGGYVALLDMNGRVRIF